MPRGIYKHKPLSKKHKENLSKTHKGKHFSEKHKDNISKALKGKKKQPFSEKHINNLSKAHIGIQAGKNHPMWKGGKSKHSEGYILIRRPKHPYCNNAGYVLEHRLIMEQWLRKNDPTNPNLIEINNILYLKRKARVHHHEKRNDNRIKKLRLFANQAKHMQYHDKLKLRKEDGKFC